MYNSTNLPLEPRKVIKKSIGSIIAYLIVILIIIGAFSFIKSQDTIVGDISNFSIYSKIIGWTWISYIIIIFINIFYQYLYYKFYYYNFQEDSAEIKKGVVSQATGHVNYPRIQNIYLDQDILDRIMGLYDVHYETAGESSAFYSHVDGLNKVNADKLVQFLLAKAKNTPSANENRPVTETTNSEQNIPPSAPINLSVIYNRENLPISSIYSLVLTLRSSFGIAVFTIYILMTYIYSDDKAQGFANYILIFIALMLVILFIINYLSVKYIDYSFDQMKGTLSTGFFSRQTKIVFYNRIQNINMDQSFIEKIFGLYKIYAETAGEKETNQKTYPLSDVTGNSFIIPGLKKEEAEKLKGFLLENSKANRANI